MKTVLVVAAAALIGAVVGALAAVAADRAAFSVLGHDWLDHWNSR